MILALYGLKLWLGASRVHWLTWAMSAKDTRLFLATSSEMPESLSKHHYWTFPGLDFHTRDIPMLHLTSEVCWKLDLPVAEVRGLSRKRVYAYTRFALYYIFIRKEKKTYEKVGQFFYRDHSSVVHGVRNWEDWISVNDPVVMPYHAAAMSVYQNIKQTVQNEQSQNI